MNKGPAAVLMFPPLPQPVMGHRSTPFHTLRLPDSLAQHRVLSTSEADSFNLKGNLCLIQWLSPPNEKIKYLTIFSIVLLLCFELGCILWCFSCSEMMNIPFKPTQCYLQMNLKRNKIAQGWSGLQHQLGKKHFSRYQAKGIYPI